MATDDYTARRASDDTPASGYYSTSASKSKTSSVPRTSTSLPSVTVPKVQSYSPATIASASSAASYVNALYAAREAAALGALKAAYDQNVTALDAESEKIPLEYQNARNQTASQSELARANFNEYASARGLNSGAGSQAQLALGNTLQSNLSGITQAESDAKAALSLQRASLETAYKNDVARAISEGNLAKAQALYDDYVRVDNSLVAASKAQADEDYRAWKVGYDYYSSLK